MASDGIVCHILIQNEQLEQVNTFPYLGSLITEDGVRQNSVPGYTEGRRSSLQKIWKSHSITTSAKIRLMKALVWPVGMYGCESWTLRKNEETRLHTFEMKGLRKILRVSWTAKKTNEWVLNKAGVKRKLTRHCQSKEVSILRSHHEEIWELHGQRTKEQNRTQITFS